MKIEDALRKIRLLREVKAENGSSEAEAANAASIIETLMDRYAVKATQVNPRDDGGRFRMSWVYWEHLLAEFGLELRRFGKRGSVVISRDTQALLRLDTGVWRVQRQRDGQSETVAEGEGFETFQSYLRKNAPRMYSLHTANQRTVFRTR